MVESEDDPVSGGEEEEEDDNDDSSSTTKKGKKRKRKGKGKKSKVTEEPEEDEENEEKKQLEEGKSKQKADDIWAGKHCIYGIFWSLTIKNTVFVEAHSNYTVLWNRYLVLAEESKLL